MIADLLVWVAGSSVLVIALAVLDLYLRPPRPRAHLEAVGWWW